MRLALLLVCLLAAPFVAAQTTHQVLVRNFEFVPASLEIQPGDTVEWTNQAGFHNVGATSPGSMPAGFGNDPAGPGWTYSFTFNEIGAYTYQCDVHPVQMQGTIAVRSVLASEGRPLAPGALVLSAPSPNPTASLAQFSVVAGSDGAAEVVAFDLLGRRVAVLWSGSLVAGRRVPLELDASALGLPAGQYVIRAQAGSARATRAVLVSGR